MTQQELLNYLGGKILKKIRTLKSKKKNEGGLSADKEFA